jgi:hypothetical protein
MSSPASGDSGSPAVRPALFTALSPLIVLLTLGAAALRAWLGRGLLGLESDTFPGLEYVYLFEAAGFVVLLVLLYAPLPFLPRDRSGIRFLMLVYALATTAAYLVIESAGEYTLIGLGSVAFDLLLIAAVIREGRRLGPLHDEPFAVQHGRATH